ncbi:SH3 domain-containing protein [candidate division WOR-3 bacterium]|nr:SH3 domain-containing protein [candidate division WOR-3 bacterium]
MRKRIFYLVFILVLSSLSFLSYAEDIYPESSIVYVKSLTANVRHGPNTTANILRRVSRGTKVEILFERDGWYKVTFPELKIGVGWIYGKLITDSWSGRKYHYSILTEETDSIGLQKGSLIRVRVENNRKKVTKDVLTEICKKLIKYKRNKDTKLTSITIWGYTELTYPDAWSECMAGWTKTKGFSIQTFIPSESKKPTEFEIKVYKTLKHEFDTNIPLSNLSDEEFLNWDKEIEKRVAKQFNISIEELKRIYVKVLKYLSH